jgi:hypothetical protein
LWPWSPWRPTWQRSCGLCWAATASPLLPLACAQAGFPALLAKRYVDMLIEDVKKIPAYGPAAKKISDIRQQKLRLGQGGSGRRRPRRGAGRRPPQAAKRLVDMVKTLGDEMRTLIAAADKFDELEALNTYKTYLEKTLGVRWRSTTPTTRRRQTSAARNAQPYPSSLAYTYTSKNRRPNLHVFRKDEALETADFCPASWRRPTSASRRQAEPWRTSRVLHILKGSVA